MDTNTAIKSLYQIVAQQQDVLTKLAQAATPLAPPAQKTVQYAGHGQPPTYPKSPGQEGSISSGPADPKYLPKPYPTKAELEPAIKIVSDIYYRFPAVQHNNFNQDVGLTSEQLQLFRGLQEALKALQDAHTVAK